MDHQDWNEDWQACVVALRRELTQCRADERLWIEQHIAQVVELKQQLHRLFRAADGPIACEQCDGACCARGQHHMTLVEVLSALLSGVELPTPDPSATCPFLNSGGCTLEPGIRPFNCVTFNCERVEDRLSADQVEQFYSLERDLRALYAAFEDRYAGASLRGLIIRSRRLGAGRLLGPPLAP